MTAVPKTEALVHAEIHAMRQVADAITLQGKQTAEHMAATTRAIERFGEKMDDMNARLIRVEEAKHGREIERLAKAMEDFKRDILPRIDNLESTRDQQKGAKALVDWVRQTTPWLLALIMAVLAAVGFKDAQP